MSTRLSFAAPADLSVGRVRVFQGEHTVADWIATPADNSVEIKDLAPGDYTALIEPLGLTPTPFMFHVEAEEANAVVSPLISVLEVAGPWGGLREALTAPEASSKRLAPDPLVQREQPGPAEEDQPRAFTIGLSQDETPGAIGGWTPYAGPAEISSQLVDGGLHIVIRPPVRSSRAGRLSSASRLRLSASIARTRVERMMVPLFAGGVRVIFSTSPMTTEDVAFRVIPNDERRRALVQALLTGGPDEASAVCQGFVSDGAIDRFLSGGSEEDPWAAVTLALLALRFPGVFEVVGPDFISLLARRYGWIPDVHLLAARQVLAVAGREPEARRLAGNRALASLRKARKLGAPYFAYANQLMGELLASLADAPLGPSFQKRARKERETWLANAPLQRSAGAVFSWVMAGKERFSGKPAAPRTKLAGNLDERFARVLFRGLIDTSRISVRRPDPPKRKSLAARPPQAAEAPSQAGVAMSAPARSARSGARAALSRRHPGAGVASPGLRKSVFSPPVSAVEAADPNKGQFGGEAAVGGYRLTAAFAATDDPGIVEVTLEVRSDDDRPASYSDIAEFVLHPTFQPRVVTSTFRGREAKLNIFAWGGFTVGVRLPGQNVSLELDLAQAPGAPAIIRDR